jgi:hypothetical protein
LQHQRRGVTKGPCSGGVSIFLRFRRNHVPMSTRKRFRKIIITITIIIYYKPRETITFLTDPRWKEPDKSYFK